MLQYFMKIKRELRAKLKVERLYLFWIVTVLISSTLRKDSKCYSTIRGICL